MNRVRIPVAGYHPHGNQRTQPFKQLIGSQAIDFNLHWGKLLWCALLVRSAVVTFSP